MNNYYVMYANPFGDHEEYPGGESYSIKCCQRACIYINNIAKGDNNTLVLEPLGKYKNLFPTKSLSIEDINKRNYKAKIFDIPNEMFKAEGFRIFLDEQMEILETLKNNPSKYYLKYNNLTIIYRLDYDGYGHYYIKYPKSQVFDKVEYDFILDYIYKCPWEYREGFTLHKYSLFDKLFKRQNKFELRNPRREAEETC